MKEHDLIAQIARSFARSDLQKNALFECDSEIVEIGDSLWGLSMDEFSPDEDLFTAENPERLGRNLAVATLSDLLAAGASPKFFMHSVSFPKTIRPEVVDGIMKGIRSILERLDCAMCGGDVGTSEEWRFCGFGMGPILSDRPLTHFLPTEPLTLWVTGSLGDANLAAMQNSPTPEFELRDHEAKLIRSDASACIDTSGGLIDALWLLQNLNPQLRFDIRLDHVPLAQDVLRAADAMGFPAETALLGGAGEYELLFALPEAAASKFAGQTKSGSFTCIGTTSKEMTPGIHFYRGEALQSLMTDAPPCPRAASTVQEHVHEVIQMAKLLFGMDSQ